MTGTKRRPVLLFDGDCGFCTASARWAERTVRPAADVLPWQSADLRALDRGRGLVTEERLRREVLWVTPLGDVRGGAEAAAKVLACGRSGWPVLGALLQLPAVRSAAAAVYRTVAANRYRLPGGTASCRL